MLCDLRHIPLDQLTVSKLNVRKHGPKDVASLAASVAALGVLQPLLVRARDGGYEIVAGQRRYLAVKSLRTSDDDTAALPCVVLDADDDAAAIEASLAENIERLPMDEMDQHEAFLALRRKGLSEPDIAAHFGISEQIVKRRLALATLIPDVRRLYRQGEIDAKTLHLLTLATKDRQKAYVALATDPEQTPPPFWQLKAWLLGGAEISAKVALFDEALYSGPIATDLFGEERYFTDGEEFWRLQNTAIAETRDKLLAAGWREVIIVPPSERFQEWDFDPVAKSKGGAVYLDVAPDGGVTVHKGLRPRGERQRGSRLADEDGATGTAPVATGRPEMSAPLSNYVDLVRHSAVRLAVAQTPAIGLRLALAHLLGGSRLWTVEAEPQSPHNDAIATWRDSLSTQAAFAELRRDAIAKLRLDDETLVARDASGDRTAAIFSRLQDMADKDVIALLAVAMAETLAMGTDLIGQLGQTLSVDVGQSWQPDDLFFDLARDREAVSAMLTEVIGETAARSYLTETGTKKKAIIRKALAGDGRAKVEGWLPGYARFPQAQYTERPLTAKPQASA
ncbi:MAG: ParB/RepB/Spo0J family partition protein [Beijerinckiaceae bacterium]|nr:ParB/RepB/Spo0J family partition protein [Beijerinckiaceae bacterium]